MAAQLKLVLLDDLTGNLIDSLDLLPWLAYRGWQQAIADLDAPVDETITLNIRGTSVNNLAQNIQDLDRMIKKVSWYIRDSTERYSVWLRAQLDGETGARQALILEAKRQSVQLLDEFTSDEFIAAGDVIGLKRGPWESTSSGQVFNSNNFPVIGTSIANNVPIVGDIDSRVRSLYIEGKNGGGGPITRCWAGFISDRWVNPANFVPIWEAENGYLSNGAAVTTANDSTASPAGGGTNKSVRVTMSNPSLVLRWNMPVKVVSPSNPEDQRGRFLVLGRFKCTDGSTECRVQLQSGFSKNTNWKTFSRQLISGSSWNIYELGQVQFPQTGRAFIATQINYSALQIFAERISGSGNLDFDCLILIPVGEGSIYFHGGQIYYQLGVSQAVGVVKLADSKVLAVGSYITTDYVLNDIIAEIRGGAPTGSSVYFVMAAARETSSVLTDYVGFNVTLFNRWMTLRGSGT